MSRLLAIAELRVREGLAARVAWLVPLAFAVGVGAASWVEGPDASARAALADRIVLSATWGMALVVAVALPPLGLPRDVRTGAAQTLLASPVSRLESIVGGTLGYGVLSALLLVATAAASILGMQAAGLGAAEREPMRRAFTAQIVGAAADGTVTISQDSPAATFRFRVPDDLAYGDTLRVRLAPRDRVESNWERATYAAVSLLRAGGVEVDRRDVRFKACNSFTVSLRADALAAGEEADLVLRRLSGGWTLVFEPGSVEVGGGRSLFAWHVLLAALCAAPMLVLVAAIGSLGAARFGAATAVVVALFLFVVFVGRDLVVDAAQFVVLASAEQVPPGERVPDPAQSLHGPVHGPSSAITPFRLALAKGAIVALCAVPRLDVFDRTGDLVERRALSWRDVGRAALAGIAPCLVLSAAGWLLFRRREIAPG